VHIGVGALRWLRSLGQGRAHAVALALVLATFCVHARRFPMPLFPVDDAYITAHNAEALRTGRDLQYGAVSALAGATSPVHLCLVAALSFFMSSLWAVDVAGWVAVALLVAGLVRLAYALATGPAAGMALVILGLAAAETPYQLLNGLETGLALTGVTWALALSVAPVARAPWLRPVLCGLLPFVRPELALLSALLLLAPRARALASGERRAFVELGRDGGLALLAAAPWVVAYLAATGRAFPATITAKHDWFAEGCGDPWWKRVVVKHNLARFGRSLGLLVALAPALLATGIGRAGLIFAAGLVGSYYVALPGALGHYEQRYLYPLVPLALWAGLSLLRGHDRWLRRAGLALWLAAAAQALLGVPGAVAKYRAHLQATATELAPVAAFVEAQVPPEARVLVHDAGYISVATHRHLVDLVGLKTPASAAVHAALTWPSCGRARGQAVERIARTSGADHLVVLRGWEDIYGIAAALRARGWTLTPLRLATGAGGYDVFRMRAPASP
jgi:hypothetical protein